MLKHMLSAKMRMVYLQWVVAILFAAPLLAVTLHYSVGNKELPEHLVTEYDAILAVETALTIDDIRLLEAAKADGLQFEDVRLLRTLLGVRCFDIPEPSLTSQMAAELPFNLAWHLDPELMSYSVNVMMVIKSQLGSCLAKQNAGHRTLQRYVVSGELTLI